MTDSIIGFVSVAVDATVDYVVSDVCWSLSLVVDAGLVDVSAVFVVLGITVNNIMHITLAVCFLFVMVVEAG